MLAANFFFFFIFFFLPGLGVNSSSRQSCHGLNETVGIKCYIAQYRLLKCSFTNPHSYTSLCDCNFTAMTWGCVTTHQHQQKHQGYIKNMCYVCPAELCEDHFHPSCITGVMRGPFSSVLHNRSYARTIFIRLA